MWLFALAMILCCNFSAFALKLYAVEIKDQPQSGASINFTLDEMGTHNVSFLDNPRRIVVDFQETEFLIQVEKITFKKNAIQSIKKRLGPNRGSTQLVFELKQVILPKKNSISHPRYHQLPITLNFKIDKNTILPSTSLSSMKKPELTKAILLKKEKLIVSSPPSRKGRDVIIALDPGHGGKDPGAIGQRKSLEKTITLSIAKKLQASINKQPGMRAILTRDGDYYIGLRERLKIARKNNADIFISIHADAFINNSSQGASVFALSPVGATSEAARWLAEKENYSELDGINLSGLNDRSGQVRTVLIDLSQTATIRSSLSMGKQILSALGKITALHTNQVEQAGFMVLKSPDIPSVLIETGFITNFFEEKKLTSPYYQNNLTQALVSGLKQYFKENPPKGTYFEGSPEGFTVHVVRSGETLSKIASLYGISLRNLQANNKLSADKIKVGQSIQVPLL